jgi:hypothetical protein
MVTQDDAGNRYLVAAPNANAADAQVQSFAIDPASPAVMVAGTKETGVFQTGDAGKSWQRVGAFAPFVRTLAFTTSGTLFASTYGRGAFTYQPKPDHAELSQSFKGTTNVFTAHASTAAAAPISGATVTFSHIDATSGAVSVMGTSVTDADGAASLSSSTVTDGYVLAAVRSSTLRDVETEIPVIGH